MTEHTSLALKLLPLILWAFVFTPATAYFDAKYNPHIRHWLNSVYRFIVFAGFIYFFKFYNDPPLYIAFGIWAFFFYWNAFNLLYNYWTKQPIIHLGDAWLDQVEAKVGPMAIIYKAFIWGFMIAAYFVSYA